MSQNTRRLVVKVGTSTLTHDTMRPNLHLIDLLTRTLADLQNRGHSVILVTSGAIAVGADKLGLPGRPITLREKQAAAAVGQCSLMHIYDKFLSEYGSAAGQILLTRDDMDHPERRERLLDTFEALLGWGVLPVVNENDSVGIEEIESGTQRVFGDNDSLSARVAALVGADLLVLLTDRDALYDSDPRQNPNAKPIRVVHAVDDALRASAGGAGSNRGTGGAATKIAAGQIALENGFDMVIAHGMDPTLLYDIVEGKPVGTLFTAAAPATPELFAAKRASAGGGAR